MATGFEKKERKSDVVVVVVAKGKTHQSHYALNT